MPVERERLKMWDREYTIEQEGGHSGCEDKVSLKRRKVLNVVTWYVGWRRKLDSL